MVFRKKISDFFMFLLAASAMMAPSASMAGDWRRHEQQEQTIISSGGLPTQIRGLGTFVGGISAVRIRGVGNFFYIQPNVSDQILNPLRPRAKIINAANGSGCSMENGVCVIRGH